MQSVPHTIVEMVGFLHLCFKPSLCQCAEASAQRRNIADSKMQLSHHSHSRSHSQSHSHSHSHTHSLTFTHSLAHSLTLTHSLIHSLPLTPSHSLSLTLTHSRTHSLTHSLSLTHLYMHIHTHTHKLTHHHPSITLILPLPFLLSMLSLSLEKLVTCGVIRSYNCFVCFWFCWLVSLLHHSLPAQGRRAF